MAVGRLKTETQLADFIRDELDLGALLSRQSSDASLIAALTARFPVADLDLASPNNGVWRVLAQHTGRYAGAAAGTYGVTGGGVTTLSGGDLGGALGTFRFIASEFAVPGKITKLRLVVQTSVNAVAPANTLTHGLHTITASAGGVGVNSLTLGAAVAGSAVAVANPGAGTFTSATGPEFAAPADANYILGLVSSGGAAANSVRSFYVQLQMRHV